MKNLLVGNLQQIAVVLGIGFHKAFDFNNALATIRDLDSDDSISQRINQLHEEVVIKQKKDEAQYNEWDEIVHLIATKAGQAQKAAPAVQKAVPVPPPAPATPAVQKAVPVPPPAPATPAVQKAAPVPQPAPAAPAVQKATPVPQPEKKKAPAAKAAAKKGILSSLNLSFGSKSGGIYGFAANAGQFAIIAFVLIAVLQMLISWVNPQAGESISQGFSEISTVGIKFNTEMWSNFIEVFSAYVQTPWVKALTKTLLAITFIAMLDVISGFTGADFVSIAGFIITIFTSTLLKDNAPLGFAFFFVGETFMRRERDSQQNFWYVIWGITAVSLIIHFFARDYYLWPDTSLWPAAKLLAKTYFSVTSGVAGFMIWAVMLIGALSYFQSMKLDGTAKAAQLYLVMFALVQGWVMYTEKTMPVFVPGGESNNLFQTLGIFGLWGIAFAIETREQFARRDDKNGDISKALIPMIFILGGSIGLAKLFHGSMDWKFFESYTAGSLIVALILGLFSLMESQEGEGKWKGFISNAEVNFGDVITFKYLPFIFYPTLLAMGYYWMGLVILTGGNTIFGIPVF